MPARKLEAYVNAGLKAGAGVEPSAVAEAVYHVASRNEKVPLRLPLSSTAVMLMKGNFQGCLQDLEAVKELSAIER